MVDDDVDVAESVAAIIEVVGHRATTLYDGLYLLDSLQFLLDVIFLDLGFPWESGYQAAAMFRHESRLDPTRLVALTGWGTEAHRQASKDAGFDSHLTKPVSPEALIGVLLKVAGRSRR